MAKRLSRLVLVLATAACHHPLSAEEVLVSAYGEKVSLGNASVVISGDSDRTLRLEHWPRVGKGFCRKKVTLFDVIDSVAVPSERSIWLYARSDGNSPDPCSSTELAYAEFDETEPQEMGTIDSFVEVIMRVSAGKPLPRGTRLVDPKDLTACLQDSMGWTIAEIYQDAADPPEGDAQEEGSAHRPPPIIVHVAFSGDGNGCAIRDLYFRGVFTGEEGEVRISVTSAASIAW